MTLKSLTTTSSMAVTGLLSGLGLTVGIGGLGMIANAVNRFDIDKVAEKIASFNSYEIDNTVLDTIAAELASSITITDDNRINIYSIAESIPFFKLVSELSKLESVAKLILPILPPGISGLINEDVLNTQVESGVAFSSTSLIDNIIGQTQEYAKNSVSGLINTVLTGKNFVEQSLQNYASMEAAARLPSQSPSFNSQTLFDQITTGILNGVYNYGEVTEEQLGDPNSVSNTIYKQTIMNQLQEQLYSLGADMIRFGNMYDITNLSKTFTLTGFMENLINQGINLRPAFLRLNFLYNKDTTTNPTILKKVFVSVRGSELEQIKNSLGFSLPISTLDQALDHSIVLNPKTLALVKNFDGLVARIENIGPNFASSFNQLGTILQKIELPRASDLLGLESDLSKFKDLVSSNNNLKRKLGTGTGILKNPTMDDVLTSMTGASYNYLMLLLISGQNKILATGSGKDLFNSLTQAIVYAKSNTGDDGTESEYKHLTTLRQSVDKFLYDKDVDLRENIALCQNIFAKILDKLITEKINIRAARLDLNNQDPGSEVLNVNSFVFTLEDASTDENNLGFRSLVENLASNDLYGEAIRATIIEAKNKRLLRDIGVTVGTPNVVDIISSKEIDQEISDSLCCGPQIDIQIVEPGQVLEAKGRLVVYPRSGIWYLGNHLTVFPKLAEYRILKYTLDSGTYPAGTEVSESFGDSGSETPTIDFQVRYYCFDEAEGVSLFLTDFVGIGSANYYGIRVARTKNDLLKDRVGPQWSVLNPNGDLMSFQYPPPLNGIKSGEYFIMVAAITDINQTNIPANNKIKSINVVC